MAAATPRKSRYDYAEHRRSGSDARCTGRSTRRRSSWQPSRSSSPPTTATCRNCNEPTRSPLRGSVMWRTTAMAKRTPMHGQRGERPESTHTTSHPKKPSKPSRRASPAAQRALRQHPQMGSPSSMASAGIRRPHSRRRPECASSSSSPRTQRGQTSPTSPQMEKKRRTPSTSTSSRSSSPPSGTAHRHPLRAAERPPPLARGRRHRDGCLGHGDPGTPRARAPNRRRR